MLLNEYVNSLVNAKRYEVLSERTVLDIYTKLPEDKEELEALLIKTANANKFSSKDYYNWGYPGYTDKEENERLLKKFKTYKLGYCFTDTSSNYICYNFKDKTFHFFHHEYHGCENMEREPWTIDRVVKYIKETV